MVSSLKLEDLSRLSGSLECMKLLFPVVVDEDASSSCASPFLASPLRSELSVNCSACLANLWNPYVRAVVPWEPLPSRGYRGAIIVPDKD